MSELKNLGVPQKTLLQLASKYIWWKSPIDAIKLPERVIAQVMNIGDYADVQILANLLGEENMRTVLKNAECGQFNERSWTYWHYRLGLADVDNVPPMILRRFS